MHNTSSQSQSIPRFSNLCEIVEIEKVPVESRWSYKSTYDAIRNTVNQLPDTPAIRYVENGDQWLESANAGRTGTDIEISYGELLNNINRVANLFHSLGVDENNPVAMLLPNIPEAHYVLWGGEAAGVVCPVNYMLEAEEIGAIINATGAGVLVVMGEHPELDIAQKTAVICKAAPGIKHVLVVGEMPQSGVELGYLSFAEQMLSQVSDDLAFKREISHDTIASLFHTGGTTGLPKLAQHTHQNELYAAAALGGISGGEMGCLLTGLPLFHVNASLGTGLSVLVNGGTILLAGIQGYRSPGILMNLYPMLEHFKVQAFSGVPTVFGLLSQIPASDYDLSSVEFAICGAAPMPVELFNRFYETTGIRIIEGYGLTEATMTSTINPPGAEPKIGSIGIRLPYTQVKTSIVDEHFKVVRDCEYDEVGTILIRGPSVFPGYTDEDKNKQVFVEDRCGDVWLNTGDLGRQDRDGYFWITGREKELIIRGGHNIDPKIIEEVLAGHPDVNLSAAIGRPDAHAGEIPVAYVELLQGKESSEQDLLEYCQERIPERAAIPKSITILEQLPVTGVGKIHKPTLQLLEIESLIKVQLQPFASQFSRAEINAHVDRKYGISAEILLSSTADAEPESVEKQVREMLDSYSFCYQLTLDA